MREFKSRRKYTTMSMFILCFFSQTLYIYKEREKESEREREREREIDGQIGYFLKMKQILN